MKHKAFTLAEIMIVLTIIGVLTMILLPIANHSRPDEAVMKFKKADTTLKNVIRELVNSDQYYLDGDLGVRKLNNGMGQLLDGSHDGDYTYFCNSFADILSTKSTKCSSNKYNGVGWVDTYCCDGCGDLSEQKISSCKTRLDKRCKDSASTIGAEIITNDNIIYYQSNPKIPYGIKYGDTCSALVDNPEESCSPPSQDLTRLFIVNTNSYNLNRIYKEICVDIDGIGKGEDPFGYGVRVDGKIMTGARADEWLEKGFQKGKDEN